MQEILDDDDIKNKKLAPLEKELGGLEFWLFFSGILLLIAGILGVFGMIAIVRDIYYSNWLELLFFGGMIVAFMIALPMAYMHFKCVKNSKNFCEDETAENFEKLLMTSSKDWRLLAVAFVFCAIAIIPLITYETYREWNRQFDTMEKPLELSEPEPDGRLNSPQVIEHNLPAEEVPLEEDPAPE